MTDRESKDTKISQPDPDEADTEGHSLLSEQLGRTVAQEHSRQAAQWSKGERARKSSKPARGGLLKRLLG